MRNNLSIPGKFENFIFWNIKYFDYFFSTFTLIKESVTFKITIPSGVLKSIADRLNVITMPSDNFWFVKSRVNTTSFDAKLFTTLAGPEQITLTWFGSYEAIE